MQEFPNHMAWIGRREGALVKRLKAWSAINSGSYNAGGVKAMAEAAKEAFSGLGTSARMLKVAPEAVIGPDGEELMRPLGPALHLIRRPKAGRKILLTGHLDTVFPADHPFRKPRMLDSNTLNGPGAADMKGGILVMLTALQALERSEVAGNLGWEVLLSPDEEIGSPGSAPLLAERARGCAFGMTYEPALADGTLAGRRKGSGAFAVVARGRSAHAGREFEKGRNAIAALAAFICDLFALNGRREGVTVNPGRIEGGGPLNIVPDLAIVRFNVRIVEPADKKWFEGEYKKLLQKHGKTKGITLKSHGGFSRMPKILSPENERLFEVLKSLGRQIGVRIAWKPTGGVCEGNNLAAAGLPNIDTLGVRGGKIHTAQEFALLDSLVERARLSALLLLNFAAGNFTLDDKGTSL